MVHKVFAGITMRFGEGVHFGTLVRIRGAHAGISTDARFAVGDVLEFQLDLPGKDRAVVGLAEVTRADLRADALNRYLLRIRKMRREDQAILLAWCEEQQPGSSVAHGHSPGFEIGAAIEEAVDSTVSSTAAARVGRDLPTPPSTARHPETDSFATFSISSGHHREGTGRAAIRAVLRAAAGEPVPRARGEAVVDPTAAMDQDGADPRIEIHYATETAWRRDWDAWLHQGLLFVPFQAQRPALDRAVQVRLTYEDRLRVECAGRVVLHHPLGFGVALDVDPVELQCLDMIEADPEQAPPAEPTAPPPPEETGSQAGQSFWRKLFGLPAEGTLEAALAALPSPLAPLEGLTARQRRRLDAILAARDKDYLELCEAVAPLLRTASWRWKDLEQLAARAQDPEAEAAAWVVLTHVSRREAIDVLLEANHGASAPVRVVPGERGACLVCARHVGVHRSPLELARRGLPPFHLGCDCRVVLAQP